MYDEAADVAAHLRQIEGMDEQLDAAGVRVDWPNALVCDIGGGGGLRAAMLAARARRCYCADVIDQQARYGGQFARLLAEKVGRHGMELPLDRFEFHVADAMRLLYRDGLFDFICSFNAFEHIPDPSKAFGEVARVLRPGGIAFISFDPIWTADTGSHYAHRVAEPWAHLVLTVDEFRQRMAAAGAERWELDEFPEAMNRVRLRRFREIFREEGPRSGLEVMYINEWQGLVNAEHEHHPFLARALESYDREELMMRGMAYVFRRAAG